MNGDTKTPVVACLVESNPTGEAPLLIDAPAVALMLSISKSSLYALKSAGGLPRPIRPGRSVRWRAEALRAWVAEGRPNLHRRKALRLQASPGAPRLK